MDKETKIKSRLDSLLSKNISAFNFVQELSDMGEIIFLGGSIRDLFFENWDQNLPRDYDIVVKLNVDRYMLEGFLSKYEYNKNRFDGYKIKVDGVEFDIWILEKTWAFNNRLLKSNEKNLIKTVYLSVDGIAFNYTRKKLYDNIFRETNDKREISVVLKENPQKELNLLRALVFKQKYNYKLSSKLKSEYRKVKSVNGNLSKVLYDLQLDHYKEEKLSLEQIESELSVI
jgi:hypothetical protein